MQRFLLRAYIFTKGVKDPFSLIIISQREGLSVRVYCILYNVKNSHSSSSCKAVVKAYGTTDTHVLCRL